MKLFNLRVLRTRPQIGIENSIFSLRYFVSVLALAFTSAYSQEPIEIRLQPKDDVYVYETKGTGTSGELYTAVIQNFAIVNNQMDSLTIRDVSIMAIKDGVEVQRVIVPNEFLSASAKKYHQYQNQGVLTLYDFQFQTSKYLDGIDIASTTTLSNNEALIVSHRTLLFQNLPDSIKVKIKAYDTRDNAITTENALAVVNHKSENEYFFPLRGTWVAAAAPSLIGHHRWASIQEFAFDFVKLGASGKSYTGDGSKLSDYYSYGESIYSIGAGKVVSVSDGAVESDKSLKQPDETEEAYFMRLIKHQQSLLSKGFDKVLGNHIIIEHKGGEYSYYVHLKTGSVEVKLGDTVTRGQKIAELGHSGNSTEPHLHFHLTNGPDMSYSRSIPVTFHNISLYPEDNKQIRHLHSGQIIICDD